MNTMAGRGSADTMEPAAWFDAWRGVTAVQSARIYGVDVTSDELLDGHDRADVAAVLLDFVGRVLDSLGPARAAEVLQRWGVVVTVAEGVTDGPRR